jgi:UTP-glucose-1-phosphate uridylyltransferase
LTAFHTCIVPCAGLGTRMRPLLGDRPKALLEVAGRSVLAHAIVEARDAGVEGAIVVAHPTARDALLREARRWTGRVECVEQDSPRGLADAIRIGARAARDEAVAVLLPDNLFDSPSPLARLVALAAATGEHAVLVARMTADAAQGKGGSAPASVEPLDRAAGAVRITAVGAKRGRARLDLAPDERLDTPIGRYAFQPGIATVVDEVESALSRGAELDDVPVLALLAKRRTLVGLLHETPFYDVGNPEGYRAAAERLAG